MLRISKKNNGFTFLELLITIFVFLIGVLGSYLLAQQFISDTQISVSRLTASFLAQEGMEIVRNIRDENWLNNEDWETGLEDFMENPKDYRADYNDSGLIAYDDIFLNIENSSGLYGYGTGIPTEFKRKITLNAIDLGEPDGPEKIEVTVSITWEHRGEIYEVDAKDFLYPWWTY